MPKRKTLPTIPDIEGAGKHPESLVVQKSNPLLSLSETKLTLAQLKILDAYLGRINSHEPEKRYVKLEKGELEKLLGVTQIKAPDLEKRIDNLFQVVTIRDKNKEDGFCKIALFEKAECRRDKSSGLWQVELACTPSAMEYIFDIEKLHYLRYTLKDVIKLTSRYSYTLYLYLENNRRMHLTWEVSLDDLKTLLRCNADTYKQYYRFNEMVLSRCHKELNEKTSCHFKYESVKKGRAVKAVRFTLEPRSAAIEVEQDAIPGQMDIYDYPDIAPDPDSGENDTPDIIRFYSDACPGFTIEEMQQIVAVLATIPDHKLPDAPTGDDDIELMRYHYLCERYAALNVADKRRPIKNRFNYFIKMLKADAGQD